MNKWVQRFTALVVMLAVVMGSLVWLNAKTTLKYQEIGGDSPVVMTINGSEVRAEEYATYMLYNMKYYENMYASYGIVGLWDDPSAVQMLGAMMPESAMQQAAYTRVLLEEFEKAGLKMPYDLQKAMTDLRQDTIDECGGYEGYLDYIAQMGFDDASYMNFMYVTQCYNALEEYYYGENGVNNPDEQEIMQYFRDNYMSAKHILIMTVDPATGETSRTDEEARAEAQAILDRIRAGEDFDTLMNEYSEDGGLATNPNGYTFTEGQMVESFYEGAKALEVDAVSEVVPSEYGYHIIKHLPLDESAFENARDTIVQMLGYNMDALVSQWMNDADVQTTEVYGEINTENVLDYAPAGVAALLRAEDEAAQTPAEDEAAQTPAEDEAAQTPAEDEAAADAE